MEVTLHANAVTTPKVRARIQAERHRSAAELARELGVSERTVRRWRSRDSTEDRSSTRKRLHSSLGPLEEQAVVLLRGALGLSLDDITEVMRRMSDKRLSRSSIHRCLQRLGCSAPVRSLDKTQAQPFRADQPLGFIHCDVKVMTALKGKRSYAFVAIDRATRFVFLEMHDNRRAETACGFFSRFLDAFPAKVHRVLTDNGSEWTDRFSDSRCGKPKGVPSGLHAFDRMLHQHKIKHKLTAPYHPQTNGMVERFNRRLGEHLAARPKRPRGQDRRFSSHNERNQYISDFVNAYNNTQLKCLNYQAPIQMLTNLTGHNTEGEVA